MDRTTLRAVAEQATHAPSIHNSQPWRFRVADDRLEVLADRERALAVVDPTGRQLHISCGAAIEFARLGLRARDRSVTVTLLPDRGQPDLLAVLRVGAERPATELERRLVDAMGRRHTVRAPFQDRQLPDELVEELRGQVHDAGGWLHPLHRRTDLLTTAALLARADEAQREDPAYLAELRRWTDERSPGEGVPPAAVATPPADERASMMWLRDFTGAGGEHAAGESAVVERPLVVVLGTEGDDARSWVVAGQALARLLLRAAADGVQASPLNQVLDLAAFRQRLATELGLVGHPQMLLRMGYVTEDAAGTERRPVEDVLD